MWAVVAFTNGTKTLVHSLAFSVPQTAPNCVRKRFLQTHLRCLEKIGQRGCRLFRLDWEGPSASVPLLLHLWLNPNRRATAA
eukprot:6081540-Amphidinium_carterae.1